MESDEAATVVKSELEPTARVAPKRSTSSAIWRLLRLAVPSVKRLDIMSLKPGRSAGSFASPDRKASRKLIRGRRLSSTTTRPNPFTSVVSRCCGSFSGRGASGGGIWRRKASVSGISGTVLLFGELKIELGIEPLDCRLGMLLRQAQRATPRIIRGGRHLGQRRSRLFVLARLL